MLNSKRYTFENEWSMWFLYICVIFVGHSPIFSLKRWSLGPFLSQVFVVRRSERRPKTTTVLPETTEFGTSPAGAGELGLPKRTEASGLRERRERRCSFIHRSIFLWHDIDNLRWHIISAYQHISISAYQQLNATKFEFWNNKKAGVSSKTVPPVFPFPLV